MNMIRKTIDYIKDESFKIIYINNSLDIINYDNILEVKEDVVTISKNDKLVLIKGNNLKLNKLLDNEILITGIVKEIDL